ncbi:calmodulin-like protein 4 [Myxocyprinus asiaticus]|uniref:calmodulin-like protein 4 n=1 Tax=Myxocyprinus asiaticus TaxID=70543 RepID=UPI00222202EF|nr:calmodulin-like protein 4 [Myxocyprinus asiaticus]
MSKAEVKGKPKRNLHGATEMPSTMRKRQNSAMHTAFLTRHMSRETDSCLKNAQFHMDLWCCFTIQNWLLDFGRPVVMIFCPGDYLHMLYYNTSPFLLIKVSLVKQFIMDFVTRSWYKECFSLYDKKHQGEINAQDVLTVMRSLGCCPTLPELDKHLLTHKIDKRGELDFTFLRVMHQQENLRAEILRVLRMMDPKKQGFILESELRVTLMSLGEQLGDEEVNELLNETGVASDGRIDYEEFTKMVTLPTG